LRPSSRGTGWPSGCTPSGYLVGIVPVYWDGSGCNAREDTRAEAVVAGPQRDEDGGEDQHKEGDDGLGDADGEGPGRGGDEIVCRYGGLMGLGLVIKGGDAVQNGV
jgi:hypothetical protein